MLIKHFIFEIRFIRTHSNTTNMECARLYGIPLLRNEFSVSSRYCVARPTRVSVC